METSKQVEVILKKLEENTGFSIDRDNFYERFRRLKSKQVPYKKPRQESVIVRAGGKGQAVRRRMPNGEISDICECKHNADFSRGCIAQVHAANLQEVIDNHGVYKSDLHFRVYKAAGVVDQRCDYCYAFRNMGNVAPREINKKTRQSFEEQRPKTIRIGKLTEGGHPYYFQSLMAFFGLCNEFHSRVIFPTKMFPFGIEGAEETQEFAFRNLVTVSKLARDVEMYSGTEISRILKAIDATLPYSLGYNNEENGAVTQGFTNEWRIRQAERYHKEGVNVSLTVVSDMALSIQENANRGSAIMDALESHARTGINLRLMPLRYTSRNLLYRLGFDGFREELVQKPEVHDVLRLPGMSISGPVYKRRGNSEFIPIKMHPDFRKLHDSGIGICGVVDGYEHCDKCNLWQERIEFPEEELAEIDYSGKAEKPYGGNGKKTSETSGLFE